MVWNNGWINYSGEKNERSTPSLACTPVGPVPGASSLRQVWEPETVSHEQATRAELTVKVAQAHGARVALNAHGEVVVAAGEDGHEKNLFDLIKQCGHPETQEQLHTAALEAGYSNEQSTALYNLYRVKFKPLPSVPAVDGMTFPPQMRSKRLAATERDERGTTFQPSRTLATKKRDTKAMTFPSTTPTMDAQTSRDIQALCAAAKARAVGTAPDAAVRTPARPQRAGLDMVAMARVMVAFMQAQGDTSLREEIAAAKREIQVQVQRIEADRAARRLTGRA
jgi:hypothetical protein